MTPIIAESIILPITNPPKISFDLRIVFIITFPFLQETMHKSPFYIVLIKYLELS